MRRLQTRWADNDIYGHVNNVTYYEFFDTIVNEYLVNTGVLDIHGSDVIGLVVETKCQYFAPLTFPEEIDGALRVSKIGNSSVIYGLGIFPVGQNEPAAEGHFVHVYVDRITRRPVQLPEKLKTVLSNLSSGIG